MAKTIEVALNRTSYSIELREAKNAFERQFLDLVLVLHKGNVTHTARTIKMGRRNLQVRIKKLGIDIEGIRSYPSLPVQPSPAEIKRAVRILQQVVSA